MANVNKIFDWCLKQGQKGKEHRGIKKIKPDDEEAKKHINKAVHNLKALAYNIKGDFSDWAVSAAFYAMYHALLAILFKIGYESRNQKCTISVIEHLVKENKLDFDLKYISMIKRTSALMPKDAKTLREEFQYGTETKVNPEILDLLNKNTIEFVETVQILLEKIKV